MEVLIILLIYFAPALMAYNTNHKQKAGILILNLFLGWTLLGWIIALIWTHTKSETKLTVEEFEQLKEQIISNNQKSQ